MRNNTCWSIGSGHNTNFWRDARIPCRRPILERSLGAQVNNLDVMVSDFITANGTWNLDKLKLVVEEDIIRDITAIPPLTNNEEADHLTWLWNPAGICSVKTAYQALHQDVWEPRNTTWNLAWQFEGPQRFRNFIWLILRKRLLTNVERTRRGIYHWIPPVRFAVGMSILHAFRDCSNTRNICLQVESHVQDNDLVAGRYGNNVVLLYSMEIAVSLGHGGIKPGTPPEPGVLKLNTDGAINQSTMGAASGGISRNQTGDCIMSYSCHIGICSVLHAELWGLLDGLYLAWKQGADRLTVEMDNAEAIRLLKLIPREATRVVDSLACYGYTLQGGLSEWGNPPEVITSLIQGKMQSGVRT
ncbi:hypothetical protein F3Y22_tig00110372pilonHSYRG00098 [Hibiscus syriacus]|uniref:RNase H type-1 domain-containing protein n=1 Tax=Hibiscus syriacus TaxID=106335 RepID=A0A6A3AYF6_HIBSY|nr:hypothetical protein F3Y22_tig00110372pilonHSYRG00098 [Hibiscus syriacus]